MRLRDQIVSFVCIILSAVLLIGAGIQLDGINQKRQEMNLVSNVPLENAPPALAFATVALGAFRGLVVDILWMRADTLKEQGLFFDAKQLAEWITTLQPRFGSVWEFQAWNMSYNISVAIPSTQPEQRWHWVKSGYDLLRDKGIPQNPKNMLLYRELARIFSHKIGSVSDDAHKYYKIQLAAEMSPLLGADGLKSDSHEYFETLVKAPKQWRQIESDPNITPLLTSLKNADKAFTNATGDEFVKSYLTLRQNPSKFDNKAFEVIDNFRGTKTLRDFDLFAKSWQLRNTWKLEPELMDYLNKTYGPLDLSKDDPNAHLPLDWRHPSAQALYWAVKGLQTASKEKILVTEINADRTVNHSLQSLFREGKMYIYDVPKEEVKTVAYDPEEATGKRIYLRPDIRMFMVYNKAAMANIKKYTDYESQSTFESMQIGHRNMLENAALLFYQSGHKKQAEKIYKELQKLYPRPDFDVPFVEFIRNRFKKELESLHIYDAQEQVTALLRDSYFLYALRDDDESFGRENLAREVYDFYQKSYKTENRIELPPISFCRYFALRDFLYDDQFPLSLRQRLLNRIAIERPDVYIQL
ncbi:MAG: hypothetical protein E4H40_04960 [Candidatus Brocadiia bacterium]|nr:MAG: hypothetical protein E4H40_04960 [Candidatus Brocadiia bacterium]